MHRYILDTSVFTNPETYRQFGADTRAAVAGFLHAARQTPARFYMPTSVWRELTEMKDLGDLAGRFQAVVRIRSPRRYELTVPAEILYQFINEMRVRIDRGLRVAEEYARLGAEESSDPGAVINRLRERYRDTLRQGIIDSHEDADVLLLALELDGTLVTADQGLRRWADRIGVEWASAEHFGAILAALVEDQGPAQELVQQPVDVAGDPLEGQ